MNASWHATIGGKFMAQGCNLLERMYAKSHGLFSDHFVEARIPEDADYRRLADDELQNIMSRLRSRLEQNRASLRSGNEEDCERTWITPLLQEMGFGLQWRRQIPGARTLPDYLLYLDQEASAAAFQTASRDGFYSQVVGLLEAKKWDRNLSEDRVDSNSGQRSRSPHLQIRDYLTDANIRWGVLTNGRLWRLFCKDDRAAHYFEINLDSILHTEDLAGLRLFVTLFGPEAFAVQPSGQCRLDRFRAGATQYREDIERRLREQVFEGVESLAKGFRLAGASDLGQIYENSLILLYRVLFVLNAESRGLLPTSQIDTRSRRYIRNYGLIGIQDELKNPDAFTEDTSTLYHRLQALFKVINGRPPQNGEPDINVELDIPRYNGGLFDSERFPFLDQYFVTDKRLKGVLQKLMFRREPSGDFVSFDYASLGERHLGSIYEGLLEHTLCEVAGEYRLSNEKGQRKSTGAYYTPEPFVRYIVKATLTPLLDELDSMVTDGNRLSDEFAESVLTLNVCDPAMGSAHFLVEAVTFLAEKICAHRTTKPRPQLDVDGSPVQKQDGSVLNTEEAKLSYWKRRVVESCIYGVDTNPLAVELAKLSLWLKTVDRVPLNFLDHHLRCGDALLGTRIEALPSFLNPAKVKKAYDWSKPKQLDVELTEFLTGALRDAIGEINAIEAESTDTHAVAKAKEAKWKDISQRLLPPLRAIADLWILPWFAWDENSYVRYESAIRDPGLAEQKLAEYNINPSEFRFFHWELEFPDVFYNSDGVPKQDPGFDAVIGNPPWERVKLQENEYFSARFPDIATTNPASARKAKIQLLKRSNPEIYRAYERAKHLAECTAYFLQRSGFFPMMGKGDTNLYTVFTEQAHRLARRQGRVGYLVPSGISSDKTTSEFFAWLVSEKRLGELIDFENKGVFEDVHSSFKFSILLSAGVGTAAQAKCAFYLQGPKAEELLANESNFFRLSAEDFALFNPNTKTCPIFRTARDTEICREIYRQVPILKNIQKAKVGGDPWGISFHTMFHMTNDSGLFRTKEQLVETGFYPVAGNRWKKADVEYVPLYEGKMVQMYDHRAATIKVNPENIHRPAQPEEISAELKQDVDFSPNSFYFVERSQIQLKDRWLLAIKLITAPTNIRSIIVGGIPLRGVGNSMAILSGSILGARLELLLANMASFVLDYCARKKIGGQNLNFFILEQLPVLPPSRYEEPISRAAHTTVGDWIKSRVLELTYTAVDMKEFAEDLGFFGEPFVWDDERRLHLKCQLDAMYFLLYGVSKQNAEYILSTFPIVAQADQAMYGRFRTRDLILHYVSAYEAGDFNAHVAA